MVQRAFVEVTDYNNCPSKSNHLLECNDALLNVSLYVPVASSKALHAMVDFVVMASKQSTDGSKLHPVLMTNYDGSDAATQWLLSSCVRSKMTYHYTFIIMSFIAVVPSSSMFYFCVLFYFVVICYKFTFLSVAVEGSVIMEHASSASDNLRDAFRLFYFFIESKEGFD